MTRNTVIVTDATLEAVDDHPATTETYQLQSVKPVPPLRVVHGNVTGISGPSTPTALLDEVRVDAGPGARAAHAVLAGPGGAS